MAQPVFVRLGNHERFGRVVFEFPQPQSFAMERSGNAVVLRFPGAGDVPDGDGAARNVAAVTGGGGMATLTTAPAARVRALTMGNRVVVDVIDPAPPRTGTSRRGGIAPTASPAGPSAFHDREAAPPADKLDAAPATTPSAMVSAPIAIPAEPAAVAAPRPPEVASEAGVSSPKLVSLALVPRIAGSGTAFTFPADASVGVAAFERGDEAWLVFDERRPLDLPGAEKDTLLTGAIVDLLPSATLIRLRPPAHRRLQLDRVAEGWSVRLDGDREQALMPSISPSRLLFPVVAPGRVVVVPDRATGRNLLVGTLQAPGPGVPVTVRAPEFTVVPSWQGLVIEPVSDRTEMRSTPQGLVVETGGALSPSAEDRQTLANASALTRRFDLSGEPVPALLRRLQAQTQDEGQAPAQSRLALRKAAAQTMLALGLGPEAQSLLRLAVAEDPRAIADPDLNGLAGIAAIVSGRPMEAGGLDAPGLSGTDDVTLWRAVRAALLDDKSAEAAQAFAATVGLVFSYSKPIQNRVLPIAVESLIAGGAPKVADALLARHLDEPLLAFARAVRLEQKGETGPALVLLDALANGRDRLTSARASTRAVHLRLASGAITASEAADSLVRAFVGWRGDGRERALRLETASILATAGRWREAFLTLKETALLFPDDTQAIDARFAELMDKMLHSPGAAPVKPLDLVALAEENADQLAKSGVADLAPLLADKLLGLDLPDRAGPLLERMIGRMAAGANRASLGARLAALRLASGNLPDAVDALATTDEPDLPGTLAEERGMLQARIAAARHDVAGATAILARIATAPADELRATILGDSGDWRGAASALTKVASDRVPSDGTLTPEQQDLLLRLASAEVRAGDDVALHKLAQDDTGRMSGSRGDMFRLLTSSPILAGNDLRRSSQELAMLRELPSAVATVGKR